MTSYDVDLSEDLLKKTAKSKSKSMAFKSKSKSSKSRLKSKSGLSVLQVCLRA